MTKLFVWISGLRGPEAQLWDELKQEGGKPVKYLVCHAVEDKATLADCVAKYPAPIEAKE